jgi:phosphoglycolate phosphatase
MHAIKGILFDLDGTLVDSVQDLAASVNYTLRKMGFSPREISEIRKFVGDGVQKLIVRSLGENFAHRADEAIAIFMDHYNENLTKTTTLYNGVLALLSGIKADFRLGVLTNKSECFSRKILDGLGIASFFDVVIGGDTLSTKKPNPAGLLHAAALWGIHPGQMLMVGDHVTDLLTGKNGGSITVFIKNGIGEQGDAIPDYAIASIGDLSDLLSRDLKSGPLNKRDGSS